VSQIEESIHPDSDSGSALSRVQSFGSACVRLAEVAVDDLGIRSGMTVKNVLVPDLDIEGLGQ
jgi:hypothetical protein